jgi:hypothetical protein
MIPKEIFHYTKKDIALEKILFEKKIRIGKYGLTNDPRESQKWVLRSRDEKQKKKFDDIFDDVYHETNRVIANEWKVFCASQHHPDYRSNSNEYNPFLSGYCRPRMWASYAENHKGVCLKFNGEKFNEQINKDLGDSYRIFHGPVLYDDIRSLNPPGFDYSSVDEFGLTESVRKYFFKYWREFFLTKANDWETEYEYRWIIHSSKSKQDAEYLSIDGIIEGVLVGPAFPKLHKTEQAEQLKRSKSHRLNGVCRTA